MTTRAASDGSGVEASADLRRSTQPTPARRLVPPIGSEGWGSNHSTVLQDLDDEGFEEGDGGHDRRDSLSFLARPDAFHRVGESERSGGRVDARPREPERLAPSQA